ETLKKQKFFAEGDTLYNVRVKELQPIWKNAYEAQVKDLKEKVKTAQDRIKTAKQEELAGVKEAAQALQRDLDTLMKKGTQALQSQWEEKEAYITDAYRLVANDNLCLACHQVSNLEPKQRQGPSLNLAWERLRPEWTQRWIASPQRFLTYTTPMPQNFPKD